MPAPLPLTEVASTLLRDVGALLARVLVAWLLLVFHVWDEARAGFSHFFGPKAPWPLSDAITAAGLPGVVAAFVLGLLTRVAAFVLLVVMMSVAAVASVDVLQETAGAYVAVACTLLLGGPGHISLDALVIRWRSRKRKSPPKYR